MISLSQGDDGRGAVTLSELTPSVARNVAEALAAMDPWAKYPIKAADLESYLTAIEPGAPRYLIDVNGEAAGVVGLRLNWLRGPYLQLLAILPVHQRKGIGELVLAWFEGSAIARNEKNIWVAASSFNAAALRFYERHGFKRAALFDDLVRDGYTEVLLRKRLSSLGAK